MTKEQLKESKLYKKVKEAIEKYKENNNSKNQ